MTAVALTLLDASTDYVPSKLARREETRAYRRMHTLIGRSVPQPSLDAGASAILVPGFISGDVSLASLARQLRRSGHRTFRSEIGANLGCTDAMVDRLIARSEQVVREEGRPVALVGHSRGGMIVSLAARRRPELFTGAIVLSAPVTGTLSVAAHVRQQLEMLFRLHRRGFRGVISEDCVIGECAARVAAELDSDFPADVAYISIYSQLDAIIDWHTSLAPAAELIEVNSSHTGMGTDPYVHRIVAERLTALTTSRAIAEADEQLVS